MISTALWLDAADASTVFTTDTGSTLAANNSAVGRWNDKSGNGFHLLQATSGNRPTYATNLVNGRNGITFTAASNHYLDRTGGSWGTSYVAMTVCRTNASTTGQAIFATRSTSSGLPINPQISISGADQTQFAVRDDSSNVVSNSIATHPVNTWVLMGGTRNNNSVTTYRDGTAGTTGTATFGTISTTITAVGALNSGSPTFGAFFSGNIAEIIIAPIANLQKIEGYLAHKWGLESNLPNDHPYKTTGPTP
jgi:hypothetical protein